VHDRVDAFVDEDEVEEVGRLDVAFDELGIGRGRRGSAAGWARGF
jgi:hypothetical protein